MFHKWFYVEINQKMGIVFAEIEMILVARVKDVFCIWLVKNNVDKEIELLLGYRNKYLYLMKVIRGG